MAEINAVRQETLNDAKGKIEDEMVRRAKAFGWKDPRSSQPPSNLSDVLKIYASDTNNYDCKRKNEIFEICYGMFRAGQNQWLVDIAGEFMLKKGWSFENVEGKTGSKTAGYAPRIVCWHVKRKGKLVDKYQTTGLKHHKEFIGDRKKREKRYLHANTRFSTGDGYLVSDKGPELPSVNTLVSSAVRAI